MIHSIVASEEGKIYKGKVVKIVDFGAFVNFFQSRWPCPRVPDRKPPPEPPQRCAEGQEVFVKLLGFDDRGKVRRR